MLSAYPPSDVPYLSPYAPAALFIDDGPNRPWRRVLEYPSRNVRAVVRFTYLEALDDGAVLAAVQSSDEAHPAAVRIEGLPNAPRVTPIMGITGRTLRWISFRDGIYRIAGAGSDARASRSTDGGRSFEQLDATSPESFAATDTTLFLLDGGALYASGDGIHFERVAASQTSLVSPPSALISSPLVAHAGSVWSASVRTGEIFEAVPR